MPREPPATLLCLSVIAGAGQGRNFSLKFSSSIRFSYSLWTSIPWAHKGSLWISSLILVELQAQQCRGSNSVFFHWLHWSMLAAAGVAGKREQNLFGKGYCSKWQKLLKKLLLNGWITSLRPQCCRCKLWLPQVALSCRATMPSGGSCVSHTVWC